MTGTANLNMHVKPHEIYIAASFECIRLPESQHYGEEIDIFTASWVAGD
jgi:hypothetical protein